MVRTSELIALLALAGCGCTRATEHAAEQETATAVPVHSAPVTRKDIDEVLTASGPLMPLPGADVKLGALVSGRVAEVLVAEGDRVTQGQLLARLEATPFRDALAQAEAQLAQARSQKANDAKRLERAQTLFGAGVAARQEVDDAQTQAAVAEAAIQGAEAAVSTARNQLSRTELRAPFAGSIAHVFIAAGEPVDGTGKAVLEVAHTEKLEVRGVLPVAAAQRLRSGLNATVAVSGVVTALPARVVAVSPLLDPTTGTAMVRVGVDNADGLLKGGQVAEARIVLGTHPGTLTIPDSAVLARDATSGAAEHYVEMIDGEGHAQPRSVKVGIRSLGEVEILEGLHDGEKVIVQGGYALPPGTPVRVEGNQP